MRADSLQTPDSKHIENHIPGQESLSGSELPEIINTIHMQ